MLQINPGLARITTNTSIIYLHLSIHKLTSNHIEELLDGKQIDSPPAHGTFKKAVKEHEPGPYQG